MNRKLKSQYRQKHNKLINKINKKSKIKMKKD